MGLTVEQKNERDRVTQKIPTFTSEGKEDYVFISYKSDDWERVLGKIVRHMVETYGLKVYFDKNFDRDNDSWVSNMTSAIRTGKCRAVLAFVSKRYMVSYACLMELLTARGYSAYMDHDQDEVNELQIFPIIVDDSRYLKDAVSSSGEMVTMSDAEWSCYLELLDEAFECPWVTKSEKLKNQIKYLKDKVKKKVNEEHVSKTAALILSEGHERRFNDNVEGTSFYSTLYEAIKKCSGNVFDLDQIRALQEQKKDWPDAEVVEPQKEAPSVPVSPVPGPVIDSVWNRDTIRISRKKGTEGVKVKKPDTLLEYWEGFCKYTDRNGIAPTMKVSKAAERNWHAIRLGSAIIRIECTVSFSKDQLRTAYYVQEAPEVFAKAQEAQKIIDEALESLGNCVWDGRSKAANVSVYTSLTDKSLEEQYAWFCKSAEVMDVTIRPYLGL